MAYTDIELRAINKFCQDNNARPELSVRPMVRFTMPSGEIEQHAIGYLVQQFTDSKKEEAKERARARRQQKKRTTE